jgi:hypothetical protein
LADAAWTPIHLRREAMPSAMVGQALLDSDGAPDGVLWAIEGDEEAIARMIELVAMVLREQCSQGLIVPPDDVHPRLITDGLYQAGGVHDIGEDERPDSGRSRPRACVHALP